MKKVTLVTLLPFVLQSLLIKGNIFLFSLNRPLRQYTLVLETPMKLGNLQCQSNFNRTEVLLLMIENIKTNQIGGYRYKIG